MTERTDAEKAAAAEKKKLYGSWSGGGVNANGVWDDEDLKNRKGYVNFEERAKMEQDILRQELDQEE